MESWCWSFFWVPRCRYHKVNFLKFLPLTVRPFLLGQFGAWVFGREAAGMELRPLHVLSTYSVAKLCPKPLGTVKYESIGCVWHLLLSIDSSDMGLSPWAVT